MRKRRFRHGPNIKRDLFEEQGGICAICDKPMPPIDHDPDDPDDAPNLDHIIPVSRGGPEYRWNLQLTHTRCNAAKSNAMPHEADVRSRLND